MAKDYDSPWTTWKCLNRLCTGILTAHKIKKLKFYIGDTTSDNNNNCLKSNIQCIEIRVQWTVHLGSSHMHVHAVTPKLVICVMYLTSI